MSAPTIKLLKRESYMAMIRNAAKGENHMFRNLYALVDGEKKDILNDGDLSCAFFVSSILALQKLLDGPHATVLGTEKAMEHAGWVSLKDLRPGAVVTWEPIVYDDGRSHWHIGFALDEERAISNASNAAGIPREHHITYEDTRKIQRIWWHPELD